MDTEALLRDQGGVISRRQIREAGGDDNLIERMLRRRLWCPVFPGVYVDHTGVPTNEQLRMAAVLYAWPAALAGESALVAGGLRNLTPGIVTVAVEHARRVREQPDLKIVRRSDLADQVMWNRRPPRLRLEVAVLQVASDRLAASGEAAAVALLADVCQQQRTTPVRLLTALDDLPGLRGRAFLRTVLHDVASGVYSVLEHRYLTRVERPHGFPRARRQQPFSHGRKKGLRDVHYAEQGLVIELDGRLGHEWAADQWADLERDLRGATEELQTVRLGWGAVASPCRLAPLVGEVLQLRGWAGSPHPCRHCSS